MILLDVWNLVRQWIWEVVRNGLMVDIAGRQRMLIQRMCKEALIIALGVTWQSSAICFCNLLLTCYQMGVLKVSVSETRAALTSVASLFEETQEALVFGIPAVGIPQLRSLENVSNMLEDLGEVGP